ARAAGHDGVAGDLSRRLHHPAQIADANAVTKYAATPWKRIGSLLHRDDGIDVAHRHGTKAYAVVGAIEIAIAIELGAHDGTPECSSNVRIASNRSAQDLRFSPGLRSR